MTCSLLIELDSDSLGNTEPINEHKNTYLIKEVLLEWIIKILKDKEFDLFQIHPYIISMLVVNNQKKLFCVYFENLIQSIYILDQSFSSKDARLNYLQSTHASNGFNKIESIYHQLILLFLLVNDNRNIVTENLKIVKSELTRLNINNQASSNNWKTFFDYLFGSFDTIDLELFLTQICL